MTGDATGAPGRRGVLSSDAELYDALVRVAAVVCRRIVSEPADLAGGQAAQRIWTAAARFLDRCGTPAPPSPDLAQDDRAPFRALWKLASDWPELRTGRLTGEAAFARESGLWKRLMSEPPMGTFAAVTASFVSDTTPAGGTLLELGAGVGVTSALIRLPAGTTYYRTDINPFLLRGRALPGVPRRYDFNEPCPLQGVDLIFAVNALHCARDRGKTLSLLHDALRPGGRLVMAEASPTTDAVGLPSVMDVVFSQLSGWWDGSGFIHGDDWISTLNSAGFHAIGQEHIIAGRHRLGWLFWASR